jgi:hypothetical protein
MNGSLPAVDRFDTYGDLLSHQYYESVGGRRPSNGPRTLMFAVLEDGIRCFLANVNTSRPFSFETLCTTFDIDAGKLRAQLASMTERRLPRRLVGIARSSRPRPARSRRHSKHRLPA